MSSSDGLSVTTQPIKTGATSSAADSSAKRWTTCESCFDLQRRRRKYDEVEVESDGKECRHSHADGTSYYRSMCKPHLAGKIKENQEAAADLDADLGNVLFAGPECRRFSSTEGDWHPPPDDELNMEILRDVTGRLQRFIAEGTQTTVIRLVVPRATVEAAPSDAQNLT